jgi:hypothetical protein
MDILCKLISIKSQEQPISTHNQLEVMNKHVATYLGDFVVNDTLDWEALIPAMAFAYITTLHRATMDTSFF